MALSTRLASAWLTSSRLPLHRRRRLGLHLERNALFFGQRLVKLANIVGDLGGIEFAHVLARLAGFGARDHQQRIEGADQAVGFLDGALERGAVFGLVLGSAQGLLRSDCASA